jgi:aspartyl-tRNA(Asn)/glutamyl-tRNA(Gln) amidotransferase subunit A
MSGEPALMSLVAVAKAIAGKKLSSREVTQSCLDRIAQWQPRVNAFMAIEADAALAAADAADAALAKGNNLGCRCTACRWRTRTCITTPARS